MCYHRRAGKVLRVLLATTSLLAAGGCAGSSRAPGPDAALADTLKAVIQNAYDFTRPDILGRMTALYSDTGRVVSTSGGVITTSPDSVRKGIEAFWQNVGHNMRNPRWVWDSVYVERLGPNAAALTGSWSIPHIAPNNQPHVIGGVWTAVFVRGNGGWKIVQEHLSAR